MYNNFGVLFHLAILINILALIVKSAGHLDGAVGTKFITGLILTLCT
jgi:hypothetical protein